MTSLASRTVSKSPLPSRLPLLLIGSGLANLSLAQTLSIHGHQSEDNFRIFDKASQFSRKGYAFNLHNWATDGIENLLRRGKPHYGHQPTLFQSCAVDAQHGGKGVVESRIKDLKSGTTVGEPEQQEGDILMRVKAGDVDALLKDGLVIEHNKEFTRFEEVVDEEGRSAVRAFFKDGSSALGSAIVAGDGVHSRVRAQLLPSITPTVLPVVCYTGQIQQEAGNLIQNTRELNRIPAYNKRAHDTDTYDTHVGDDRAMIFNYQALDWVHARIQWIYLRKPKGFVEEPVEGAEGGELVARVQDGAEEDALWKPSRRLDQARVIPAEFYDEINSLKEADTFSPDARVYVDSIKPDVGERKYNWLMRSLKLPMTKEELDGLKQRVPGGDKVFLIGDAAHAAPIVQGRSGNYSLLDGFELGTSLSAAFRSLSLSTSSSTPSTPTTTASSSFSSSSSSSPASVPSPILAALNAFESTTRLTKWNASVDHAETELFSLLQPQSVWDGQKSNGLTEAQKNKANLDEVVKERENIERWQQQQRAKVERETKEREEREEKESRERGFVNA